jgi:signal transduction histidine kinase
MTNLSGEPNDEARELLWTACHDLGSPLGTIRLCAQKLLARLRAEGPPEEQLIDLAMRIDRVAAQAVGMLDDVLEVERRKRYPYEEKPAESVGVELALGDAIALHAEALARAGCSVFVSRGPQVDQARGAWDRRALERLFSNLLQNVARHAAGTTVNVDLSAGRDWFHVRFADGGPGLPASLQDGGQRSFLDHRGGDSRHGLGLWIIHRTVAELRGEIEMHNAPGSGLLFEIRLPL